MEGWSQRNGPTRPEDHKAESGNLRPVSERSLHRSFRFGDGIAPHFYTAVRHDAEPLNQGLQRLQHLDGAATIKWVLAWASALVQRG